MKISLNEIKKLVPEAAKVDTDELIKLVGSRLVEVEEKIDLSEKYRGIYIVKVVECEPIPETHLHLCQIDAGEAGATFSGCSLGQAPVSTGPKKHIQVVCGAPNVKKGMLAVWLAPGTIVPQTFGGENFKLDIRKLRGYESNGMLAAMDELDLGDDHAGIVEIDPKMAKPGDNFAEVFDLNDIILDIENKSLTHRPDTFGLIGFAREVAGILGVKFHEPEVKFGDLTITTTLGDAEFSKYVTDTERISIEVSDQKLCPKYTAAVFGISAANLSSALESASYLTPGAVFLAKAGMRSISKIVDATNITMLLTGQPLHAFDYDKFKAVGGGGEPKISVRAAKSGETLKLLDGKEIELLESDIVICSGDVPVALAGAMGGESTEIDENTKKIILESATFSLYNERKTQMAHGVFSEAITRFTKGQPTAGTIPALARCAAMLLDSPEKIVDFESSNSEAKKPIKISLELSDINNLLGTDYDAAEIKKVLSNVGISSETDTVSTRGGAEETSRSVSPRLTATCPSWRTDLHIKEDIIEEVGRLLGYDNIPLDFPSRPFIGAEEEPLLKLKSKIRNILSDKLSTHEVLTYSFVSRKLQEIAGENTEDSYEIVNSISPELQVFRQSITPSLLEKVAMNLKAGYKDFSLYEINQTTKKSLGKDKDGVPNMETRLAFVTLGDFYQAKAYLESMLKTLGIQNPAVSPLKNGLPYLEEKHSALICDFIELGEIKQAVRKRLKIDQPVAIFELNLEKLLELVPETAVQPQAVSKFPSVERDITVKVKDTVSFEDAESSLRKALKSSADLISEITPVSIYQKDGEKTKNLSFRLKLTSRTKTLSSEEISAIMERVSKSAKSEVGAEIV